MMEREGLEVNGNRVLRGGAYYVDDPGGVRCASRNDLPPDINFVNFGFRVAMDSLK
jgi:formylglycine-generating enzyme required for sulfatase activity